MEDCLRCLKLKLVPDSTQIRFIGDLKDPILVKDSEGAVEVSNVESNFVESVRLVFIYFSMLHCGPCREFTALLSSLYEE